MAIALSFCAFAPLPMAMALSEPGVPITSPAVGILSAVASLPIATEPAPAALASVPMAVALMPDATALSPIATDVAFNLLLIAVTASLRDVCWFSNAATRPCKAVKSLSETAA